MSEIPVRLSTALGDRYRIERTLGQGGMATVYLAEDVKHKRRVAVKVLKPELAAVLGAERFLQEIATTASLQHPHILPLFDSGEVDGFLFYVMPFIDGETLRAKLDRETQVGVDDAVKITSDVADALHYAHEQGVIHRDIKPENILLANGRSMVADFGIALAVSAAAGGRLTETGLTLGTPLYMSPEQATAEKDISARSDIYSLASVCYEMLAGQPPHLGGSAQQIIMKVIAEPVEAVTRYRKSVPLNVSATLAKALEKLPADRFDTAKAFADALANPTFTTAGASRVTTGPSVVRASRRRELVSWALGATLLIAALWGWLRPAAQVAKPVARYTLTPDSGSALSGPQGRIALSPDGARLVYTGGKREQLYVRLRDQLQATLLPGTDGAINPFFSFDGTQVGVFIGNVLKLVSLTGGPPITVTDSLFPYTGASWGPGDAIYARARSVPLSLMRVAARAEGLPTRFTTLDTAEGEIQHSWPSVLPNGTGVLFTIRYDGGKHPKSAIAVADVATGKYTVLVSGTRALYAASGQLVFSTRTGTLMVAPFDQRTRALTGPATAVSDGVRLGEVTAAGNFAVSATGTLVYATGGSGTNRELVWVSRDGTVLPVDAAWQAAFKNPALSPDGTRLAIAIGDAAGMQVWVKQLDRGPSLKLTFEGTISRYPSWTPDGRAITFSSDATTPGAGDNLWTKRADGSAPAVLQLQQSRSIGESLWSPDATWLIYGTFVGQEGVGDILAMHLGADTVPVPLATTPASEWSPTLSPDGRWLAYTSTETGRPEIYVVPFPNAGTAKWPISTSGGTEPTWSHRGGELFYRDGTGHMVAVAVKTTPAFMPGRSTVLFPAAGFAADFFHRQYAVAPDDRRFLMIRAVGGGAPDKLVVVENWFEELKARDKVKRP